MTRPIVILLALTSGGCAVSTRVIGVAVGAAAGAGIGAAVTGCPTVAPGQPIPGGGRLTKVGGAAVGGGIGAAAGFLAATLLDRGEPAHEDGRVLAVITLGTPDSMAAVARALAAGRGLELVRVTALASTGDGLVELRITDRGSVPSKVLLLSADPRVRFALPDWVYRVATCIDEEQPDPRQYGRRLIRADRLHPSATGRGVTIALIDTGLDPGHGALAGGIADTIDVTGDGFTPDLHGTMVAGVIRARAGAGAPVDGVAPDVRLVAIKACAPERPALSAARCKTSALAVAVDRAVLIGAPVLNLSVAGPADRLLARLIGGAIARGRLVVAAAGNGGARAKPAFPGALPEVIGVTAVDVLERLYRSANRGDYVDVAAPGVDILTLAPGNRTVIASGTSLAAGFVSATLALLLEAGRTPSPGALRAALEETTRDLGRMGRDREFGRGVIDACGALERLTGPVAACR